MKQISRHLLPRYMWFLLWFKQWFKNPEGIKAFAHQVMNGLMQSTMRLARKLKKVNKELTEAVKTKKAKLVKLYQHATIEADDYDEIRDIVRKLGWWLIAGIAAEAALNYFGLNAVITAKGWGWLLLRTVAAVVITGFGIYIFKRWFTVVLNKPKYKQIEPQGRNWLELVVLTILCAAYEAGIYYLCEVRSFALEGASGNTLTTNFVIIIGMLLPLVAGYLAYERGLYLSPYKNTLRIARLEKEIAKMESRVATNNQKMEDHFKKELQDRWAIMEEFKVYKENYNIKHAIPDENITGHYCETHESFTKEAIERYNKQAIHRETLQPTLIITKERQNGYARELEVAKV